MHLKSPQLLDLLFTFSLRGSVIIRPFLASSLLLCKLLFLPLDKFKQFLIQLSVRVFFVQLFTIEFFMNDVDVNVVKFGRFLLPTVLKQLKHFIRIVCVFLAELSPELLVLVSD